MEQIHLIILPGWGGSHETWAPFVNFAKSYFASIHVVDLPCFGSEPCPNSVWGVSEYAKFAEQKIEEIRKKVLNQNGICVLLGHSFGGQVAVELCAKNSGIVDKLLLVSPAVFRRKKTIKKIFFRFLAGIGKLIFSIPFLNFGKETAQKMLYKLSGTPDYLKTSGIQRDIFQKIILEDKSMEVSRLSVPGGILWGRQDTQVPVKDAYLLQRLWKGSVLEILPEARHALHHETKEAFLAAIQRILLSHA